MNLEELNNKHDEYTANIESWTFFKAAYDGTKALLDYGVVKKLSEEKATEYSERLKTIFGFNLSERLIGLIVNYLFTKPTDYEFTALDTDELFSMFRKNANKQGDSFEIYMQDQVAVSKIYGHTGILVNKVKIDSSRTIEADKNDKLYPYLTSFSPPSIYDWKYELINGEKILTYLVLFDELERWNVWYQDSWEIWEVKEGEKEPVLFDSGDNDLGEIPFVVLKNGNAAGSMGGTSDIKEIARYDATLINTSHGANEIISYNAFPMFQTPMPREKDKDKRIKVAARAVIWYDPKFPNSKNEWLKTEVEAPINAIIEWNKGIVLEAYKAVSASFMNDNGVGVESGEAKKRAFQSFNSSLAKSAKRLQIAELSVLGYWLAWQDKDSLLSEISVTRPENFDVQSLIDDIDMFTASLSVIKSPTFKKQVQKTIASKTLSELPIKLIEIINKEIDADGVVFDVDDANSAADELE